MSRRMSCLATVLIALSVARPAVAAPAVTVLPKTTGLNPAGQTLVIQGGGYDPNANGGIGIYVTFGPKRADYSTNAEVYQAAKWIRPAALGGSGESELRSDGTFEIKLPDLKARYEDGQGEIVDCLTEQCLVMTFTAHGVPDRSNDTFAPVTFDNGAAAPVGRTTVSHRPTPSSAPRSTGRSTPAASASPSASTTAPAGGGPSATAGVGAASSETADATTGSLPPPADLSTSASSTSLGAMSALIALGLLAGAVPVVLRRGRALRAEELS